MRVFLLCLCLLLGAPAASAQEEGLDRAAVVAQINDYLNGIVHLQGRFTQIDAQGRRGSGVFYLQRPGRIRFEYLPRGSLLVVADGQWVNVVEGAFRSEVQRYPLRQTPLALLLRQRIDIAKDAEVLDLRRESGNILLRLRDGEGQRQGELTLIFEQPRLRLRQWIITDPQGRKTLVALSDLLEGVPVDARLFALEVPRAPQRGER